MRIYRWFLISLITLFFGFIFLSSSRAQGNLSVIIKRIQPSIVAIITYDEKGKLLRQGNGFFISKNGDVITNRYLLQGASRAEAKTIEGKAYPVKKILAEDKEGDLIRISVNIPQAFIHPLPVIGPVPEVGERIIVIGSPLGLKQTILDGSVFAVRDIPEFGKIIQINAPISSGSSGSPVIDMKGDVIGVVVSQIVKGQNLNFAIPAERVTRLKPGKGKSLAEWGKGSRKEWLTERPFLLGLSYLWAEDYENALTYFKDAVKKNPRYAKAYFYVGYCNVKLDERYTEAIEAFKQAIKIKPDYAEAYRRLGMAYAKTGRVLETNEAFEQAIKINPDYAEIIYNSLGEPSEAYDGEGRKLKPLGGPKDTEEIGFYKQLEKKRIKAIEAYKQAVGINPNDAEAYRNLGMTYRELGKFTKAIEAFKQVVRIKPNDAEGYRRLGEAYYNLRRYTEAIEAYKQVVRINPNDAEAYRDLGGAYIALGRRPEAIEAFKQVVRIKPDYAEAYHLLGALYDKLGKHTEAIEAYEAYYRLRPPQERLIKEIETCKQAVRIKPNDAEAHYNLGKAYSKLTRYREAIEPYKQAVRIKPDHAEAHYNLGIAYHELGKSTEAIEALKQVVRIKPDHAEAHLLLGVSYYFLKRHTEAVEALKQAVRIKPNDAEAHYFLGIAYLMLKDTDSALKEYKILKDLNPDHASELLHYINNRELLEGKPRKQN